MPAVFYLVARLGFIRSATMLKNWRQAVVVCAILAMIITPTVDPLNMLILMFPLISLYFLSVLTVWFAEKRRNASPKSPD
jgi:sec-independent protein translocase protein TatC